MKYTVNQSGVSLSTYYFEYSRDVGRLHPHHVYAPTSNATSYDNDEKINYWFPFLFYMSIKLILARATRPLLLILPSKKLL